MLLLKIKYFLVVIVNHIKDALWVGIRYIVGYIYILLLVILVIYKWCFANMILYILLIEKLLLFKNILFNQILIRKFYKNLEELNSIIKKLQLFYFSNY